MRRQEHADTGKACGNGIRLHVPAKLPKREQAVCDAILRRLLAFVDAEMPALVSEVFDTEEGSLCELHASGGLAFSEGEPAINVYYSGGYFKPHEDFEPLTVLIPLSSPGVDSFSGGGTGFWAPKTWGRGTSVAGKPRKPSLVLAPRAGTAMLFSGHVMHAGMPVLAGKRIVFVASFDRRRAEPG